MKSKIYTYLPFIVVALIALSCASSGTLSGGPKDETPPKMISEKSSDRIMIDYDGKAIVMEFDEYVEIQNKKEIVVSPPTKYPIVVKQRGKKVKIQFDKREELKNDATYFIGLDRVVKDFTEGNTLDKLNFVLSESSVIDSVQYGGAIHLPEGIKKDLLVMMYKIDNDSIVSNEKPYYYAKSKDGKFKFNYIKSGTYKIVAFEDQNLNLLYDQNTDFIAFLDTMLVVKDSMPEVALTAFLPEQPMKVIKKDKDTYGQFLLEFNQSIGDLTCSVIDPDSMDVYLEYQEKKILGRYNDNRRNLQLLCGVDTIKIKLPRIDSTAFNKMKLEIDKSTATDFSPLDPVTIKWSKPVQKINKDSILLTTKVDTLDVSVDADFRFSNDSLLISGLEQGRDYTVVFDSLSMIDIYNHVNDSLNYKFKILPDTSLAKLTIELDSTFAQRQKDIVVELNDGWRKLSSQTIKFPGKATFEDLMPKSYTVRIIEDDNKDGQWTTGDYWTKKHAERQKRIDIVADNKVHTVSWEDGQKTTSASKEKRPEKPTKKNLLKKGNNEAGRRRIN